MLGSRLQIPLFEGSSRSAHHHRIDRCSVVPSSRARGKGLGWRALLGVEDDDVPETVVVLCPVCAAREFGEIRGRDVA
jgi:hypothetical protein